MEYNDDLNGSVPELLTLGDASTVAQLAVEDRSALETVLIVQTLHPQPNVPFEPHLSQQLNQQVPVA
jgi:hypothetical protein